jgi:hypothetical protein
MTDPTPTTRRFPPPWAAEETDACFIIRDANRQALAYVYFDGELNRRSAAHLLKTLRNLERHASVFPSDGVVLSPCSPVPTIGPP